MQWTCHTHNGVARTRLSNWDDKQQTHCWSKIEIQSTNNLFIVIHHFSKTYHIWKIKLYPWWLIVLFNHIRTVSSILCLVLRSLLVWAYYYIRMCIDDCLKILLLENLHRNYLSKFASRSVQWYSFMSLMSYFSTVGVMFCICISYCLLY